MRNMDSTRICIPSLQFDQNKHPHATLKAFNDVIEQLKIRFNAQYPEPSSNTIVNAISKWKASNSNREPAAKDIKTVRNEWVSKDKVRKLLVFFFISLFTTGLLGTDFLFHVLKLNSCSFHYKKTKVHVRKKFRTTKLKKKVNPNSYSNLSA